MRIEFTIETRSGESGDDWNYAYACELPDKTTLETVEAHLANVARILYEQASKTDDDDDDNDPADKWKPRPGSPPAGQTPA